MVGEELGKLAELRLLVIAARQVVKVVLQLLALVALAA